MRRAVETGERQPDAIEEPPHPALGVGFVASDAMKEERLDQDSPDRMARIERGHRVLENHLHAPPQRPHFRLRQSRNVAAVEDDAARVDVDEPHERAPKRCFARPRFADDADGFAPAYPEVDSMQDFDAANAFAAQAPFAAVGDLDAARDEKIVSHATAD